MLLRSKKQASPPLKLIIMESKKKALKKHRGIYCALKRRYKIRRRNVIVPFLK
jgi:predicted YcjX-like family ATPase